MKVTIVSNGIPLPDSPLLGLFELDQAKALNDLGVDVQILCVDLRSIRRKRKMGFSKGVIDGIKYSKISFPLGKVPIRMFGIVGRLLFKLLFKRTYKKDICPNLIHAHFYDMGMISGPISKKMGIPFVITEHSSKVGKERISRSFSKILINTYKKADKLISVSEGLRRFILAHTGFDSVVVNNVVDVSNFKYFKKHHDGFGFLMTANLIPRKNPSMLLEAFAKVHKLDANCFLGFVGEGEEKEKLKKRVDELCLTNSVTFYGAKNRKDYSDIYNKYDCFILPSNVETFGVVIIEAFACGLPCIATKCGGPEYFVDKSVGILIDVGDENELVEAMIYMKTNLELFNPINIINFVNNGYSNNAIGRKLLNVYLGVVDGNDKK